MRLLISTCCALALAGCSTIYRSPDVVSGVGDATKVRVVPMTAETLIQANRSTYAPKTLPAVFSITAGNGQGVASRGPGALPDAPSSQDAGRHQQLTLKAPPAVDPGPYTIGIGDVVVLSTPATQNTVQELSGLLAAQNSRNGYTVQDDGSVNIPDVGRVRIAGTTVDAAEDLLFQRLVENQFDPTFSLEIAEFKSRRVSIGGAVGNPRIVPITLTPLYLDEALAAAGSVSVSDIDLGSVRIYREGRLYEIPLTDLYARADLQRTRLIAGDSVFVDTDYQLDRAESYFEQQIRLTQTRLSGRSQALDELTAQVQLRRADFVEGRDNFESRFEINKVCVENRKPLISAAVVRFEGQVSVFEGHQKNLPCYQCLYSVEGEENESCIENGVLAPVAGLIGTIQALQAIKVILNLGDQLSGSLLLVDALDLSFRKVKIGKDPKCPICN